VRAAALSGSAGLGAALLMAHGMAAWMRGWRACTPPPPRPAPGADFGGPAQGGGRAAGGQPAEVVGVLAAMALACAQGG